MQVNVYITRHAGRLKNKMLVVPDNSTAWIPRAYQVGWIIFGQFASLDAMFKGAELEMHIKEKGYAVLDAEVQDGHQAAASR
jgi:hypothetical protein